MGILLRVLVAAGLAADAIVHWQFAPDMAPGPHSSGGIPGDDLFRAQAIAAAVAAVLVLIWARRWTYALAFLVAASAVGALLRYYSVDVVRLGPLAAMYDPSLYGKGAGGGGGGGGAAGAARGGGGAGRGQ